MFLSQDQKQNKTFLQVETTEITRDELKFSKFVQRIRKKFTPLFNDILKAQLVLKNVINIEEWNDIKEHIQYDF